MSTKVIKVNEATITQMKTHYKQHLLEKIPPGGVFAAKHPSCMITAYRSGKVMFQGAGADSEAGVWEHQSSEVTPKAKAAQPKARNDQYSVPSNIEELAIIGSDEVGTGDYFGPIIVVAAYVQPKDMALLKELGVKDSKGLKDDQIIKIAKDIRQVIPHSVLILHNEKYNSLQARGMTQGKIKALLHNKAIGHVLDKIDPEQPDGILIDQFAEPDIYYRHIKNEKRIIKNTVYFSTKAEGVHLSVAAASIIARYVFVKEFDKLSEKAGITLQKGAGAGVDRIAAQLIKSKGETVLTEIAKVHFANTEKARRLLR
ncbi:ribonuclease HIII [Bacillus mesophilus]|uniref:Ribonuclease HIII n=1 Tax=Bacillus mesophilus TaxID=1808955 RepID=A0A6M0Q9W4_9BACI|nr:ribonuclease HIII [Bacillus mesophilus]MBM7660604.1 ribonuclease HIII [Bacillus mesophilus]NEY71848.1 ribonuclease HIII [Bacillus mesophilus]